MESQEIHKTYFDKIKERFIVVKVADGYCNLCNIYQLRLKDEDQ